MKNWILTVDDLLERHPLGERRVSGIYKFVKVAGEFRFADVSGFCAPVHADLVEDEEVGESAGSIRIAHENWEMTDWYSSTLKLHATMGDEEALTCLFGRPTRG